MVLYPNKLPESERVCFGICTAIILCEKITVDDTGIPNFSELKEFCEAKMEEIKEKTLPGYKKQEL